MKLYYTPGACSLSPHIVLHESGLDFESEKVDLAAKTLEGGGSFTKVSPKGQVPALVLDDGSLLTENAVLVQYVADQAPDAKLIPPAGTLERYRVQEWLNWVATELHKTFSPLFRQTTPDDYKAATKEMLGKKFAYLDEQLGRTPYLAGESFTVADAYAFTVLGWAKKFGMDLASWQNLAAYMERVRARPKVQDALRAEGLAA